MRRCSTGSSQYWNDHDHADVADAGVAGSWAHRHAQRFRRALGIGAAEAGAGSVLRSPVCVSRPARRFAEGAVVRRAGSVPVRQTAGKGPVCLAFAGRWQSGDQLGATGHAPRGHRLADAATDLAAAAGWLSLAQYRSGAAANRLNPWFSRALCLAIWSTTRVPIATENLADDIAALKQIIADLTRDAVVAQTEIARLKFQLALSARRIRPV